ncbi:MAG: MmcQ/YjbR family DNA-binding protein [Oscillibacter sp.]|nr:MmcQ/YjbR family DNA-binding protein [Oscillibacter sp.]MBQ7681815.1 MmcQ/YjbR family DNA-binding protein [Oscillibacter sp.]
MNREELERLILNDYNAEPEYLWPKYPRFEVFRHKSNQKWFALMMDVPKNKLGLPETDTLDVANFKCSPLLIGSLLGEAGFFPAYHMNKENWITVALDGSVSDEQVTALLDWSYDATAPK